MFLILHPVADKQGQCSEQVDFNFDNILSFFRMPDDGFTTLFYTVFYSVSGEAHQFKVKETPEEIRKMLKGGDK